MRYRLLVLVAAAIFANAASIVIWKASDGRGPDGAQVLVWVASATAVLVGLAIGHHHRRATNASDESVLVGFVSGGLAFLLCWVPPAVLLVLHPPS